jgi:hypothetical protein
MSVAEVAVVQVIGPNTPIAGVTVASVAALFVTGVGFMWFGFRQILALGQFVQQLKTAVSEASRFGSQVVELERRNTNHENRLAALERWQRNVDPLISEQLAQRMGRAPRRNEV